MVAQGGVGLLGAEVVVLMIATLFSMSYCPWIRRSCVLYLCTCDTVGFYFAFRCAAGGIGSMLYVMMWGTCWGDHIGDCPGIKYISPCGSTIGGGAGDTYGVSSGVSTLGGVMETFCGCGIVFVGGGTCGVNPC